MSKKWDIKELRDLHTTFIQMVNRSGNMPTFLNWLEEEEEEQQDGEKEAGECKYGGLSFGWGSKHGNHCPAFVLTPKKPKEKCLCGTKIAGGWCPKHDLPTSKEIEPLKGLAMGKVKEFENIASGKDAFVLTPEGALQIVHKFKEVIDALNGLLAECKHLFRQDDEPLVCIRCGKTPDQIKQEEIEA